MKSSVLNAARVLWDYHCIYDPLETADVIIGLGSYDPRVAERAADLFLEGMATWLVFTGKSGHWTEKLYKNSEAEAFAEIAIRRGVPEKAITIEPNATNIGENIRFSREKLPPRRHQRHSRDQAADPAPRPGDRGPAMAGSARKHHRAAHRL